MSDPSQAVQGWYADPEKSPPAGYRQPDSPSLSDKLADWGALAEAGGDHLFIGKDVLDVGPLEWLESRVYSTRARSYVGVDCSTGILSRRPLAARGVLWDITKAPWPFEDASFDTVLDLSTFDDTQDPDLCYAEAARVLRPRGMLMTAFANAAVLPASTEWVSQEPYALARKLEGLGFELMRGWNLEKPRAHALAWKKP